MQKSLISMLHLEFPWHDIPFFISNQPGLHSPSRPGSASALQRCGSARDTPRSTPRRCVVGFSVATERPSLEGHIFERGNHRPTMFVVIFWGHFQRFFLKSASKFVFFGFILDFGGWKVVQNLRKWEIRPTAMRSEVRSHKIGKRNWSEAIGIEIGIEATKGIIDQLYQKLGVSQPVSGISPSFTRSSRPVFFF